MQQQLIRLNGSFDRMISEQYSQWENQVRLRFRVSEIMEQLNISDSQEIYTSLNRAFTACEALRISVYRNFKKVYCSDGENVTVDWKISSLACYLIIINCNPANAMVAKAQVQSALVKSRKS